MPREQAQAPRFRGHASPLGLRSGFGYTGQEAGLHRAGSDCESGLRAHCRPRGHPGCRPRPPPMPWPQRELSRELHLVVGSGVQLWGERVRRFLIQIQTNVCFKSLAHGPLLQENWGTNVIWVLRAGPSCSCPSWLRGPSSEKEPFCDLSLSFLLRVGPSVSIGSSSRSWRHIHFLRSSPWEGGQGLELQGKGRARKEGIIILFYG